MHVCNGSVGTRFIFHVFKPALTIFAVIYGQNKQAVNTALFKLWFGLNQRLRESVWFSKHSTMLSS